MRELKFRAWDKDENVMFSPSSISWKGNVMRACDAKGNNRVEMVMENCELMQFTGLHDKNGKEIYEGDILKSNSWRVFLRKDADDKKIITIKVLWSDYSLSWCGKIINKGGTYSIKDFIDDEEGEVIGNIYENPELIEA